MAPRQSAAGALFKGCAAVIVVLIVGALGIGGCMYGKYKSCVSADEAVSAAEAEVGNQCRRQFELVPNLVQVVKAAAAHESDIIKKVTDAQAALNKIDVAGMSGNVEKQKQFDMAQASFVAAMRGMIVVAQNYPDIKANRNFIDLQAQVEGSINRVTVARRDHQKAIQDYNSLIRPFGEAVFGFKQKQYFKASEEEMRAPKVDFSSK